MQELLLVKSLRESLGEGQIAGRSSQFLFLGYKIPCVGFVCDNEECLDSVHSRQAIFQSLWMRDW